MSFWNPERIALLQEVWAKSSHAQLVEHFPGATYNAIRKKAHRLGLPHRNVVIGSQGLPVTTLPAEVAEPEFDPAAALKQLEALGYELNKRQTITDRAFTVDTRRFAGDVVKIGVVSDTHLCSRHQQLTHLKTLYQRFYDEGIDTVLHAGDLVEGIRMYRGWELEVLHHGCDEQAAYAVEHYPSHPGMKTYLISGNHDASFRTNGGVNIVKRVCNRREDMIFLGDSGAYLDLPGGMKVYLQHGAKGVPYARSFRLQKAAENFPQNTFNDRNRRPDLYIVGHYHVTATLPDYQNIFSMKPGCFQSQTEFLRRLGLCPDVGGWILEYKLNPDCGGFDLAEISAKWIPFRETIPNDY